MKNESENKVEDYLCASVKAYGGLCIKLNPFWYIGIQDRLVLLPGGRIGFAELKNPSGGHKGEKQKWWRAVVQELGFRSEFLSSKEAVDAFLCSLHG